MTSLWLQSSIKYKAFIDFGLLSAIDKNIYVDFGFGTKFYNGAYSSLYFKSEFFNFNGDLSIKSSFEKSSSGDFSFISRYRKGLYSQSFSLISSVNKNKFTSMSAVAFISSTRAADFDIVSRFSRAKFGENIFESFAEKRKYEDLSIGSRYGIAPKIRRVSFSFGSSFRFPYENKPPIRMFLDNIVWPHIFSIKVLSTSVPGYVYDIGHFSMTFNNILLGVAQDAGSISVVPLKILGNVYAKAGSIEVLKKRNLSPVISKEFRIELSESRLNDFLSSIISFKFSRIIYDFEENIGDHLTVPILYKKLDIRRYSADIKIPFADILRTISDSRMYGLISMPKKNTIIENPVEISNSIVKFKVDIRPTVYKVSGFINGGIYTRFKIRNNLKVEDFSNTGITLPRSVLTSVCVEVESKFVNYITLTNKKLALSSLMETHPSSYLGELYYNTERTIVSAGNPKVKSDKVVIVFITGFGIPSSILPPGTESCSTNGREVFSISNRNNIEISIDTIGKDGIFRYSNNEELYIGDSLYSFCKLSYNKNIDTDSLYGAKIALDIFINSSIDFNDAYYAVKPIIFSSTAFPDLYYDAHFSMDTKEDLDGIISEESNLMANIFYNGENILSGEMTLTVFNYE